MDTRRLTRVVALPVAWTFVLATLSAPATASGAEPGPSASPAKEGVDSARAHYKRGVQLYDQGSYESALGELQLANQLAPTYRLSYNIALVQMRLGDHAGAIRSFRTYLEAGGAEVPAARRAEVQSDLVDLVRHVGHVEVTASVAGADVVVDDRPAGTTPLSAPLELNPGPHRITASKSGFATATRLLDVAEGDQTSVPLTLTAVPAVESAPAPVPELSPAVAPEPAPLPAPAPSALPPPGPAAVPPAPSSPPRRPSGPPLWIGWTVTGVLASGAVATGIAALGASHQLGEDVNDHATSEGTIHSAHQTTVTLALVSDLLTAAAVIAAGTTTYLLLTSRPHERTSQIEMRFVPGGLVGTF